MEISFIGWIHTILGTLAIFVAVFIIAKQGFISVKNSLGKFYLIATIITAVTALMLYKYGGFNHGMTSGWVREEKDGRNWFQQFKPKVVIIAAGKVGGINANANYPADFILENIKIQTNIIEIAYKNNVKRLLFLGSSCIYPKYANQPIKEEYLLNNSLEPTNEWYAIAKIAGIKLCQALRIQYGFDAISLMPTNLYGPGDNYKITQSHVLPALIRKFDEAVKTNLSAVECWGNGTPKREFMHVDDLADALTFLLEEWKPESPSSPRKDNGELLSYLNIGTGKDISIKELAEKIAYLTDYKGEISWDKSCNCSWWRSATVSYTHLTLPTKA